MRDWDQDARDYSEEMKSLRLKLESQKSYYQEQIEISRINQEEVLEVLNKQVGTRKPEEEDIDKLDKTENVINKNAEQFEKHMESDDTLKKGLISSFHKWNHNEAYCNRQLEDNNKRIEEVEEKIWSYSRYAHQLDINESMSVENAIDKKALEQQIIKEKMSLDKIIDKEQLIKEKMSVNKVIDEKALEEQKQEEIKEKLKIDNVINKENNSDEDSNNKGNGSENGGISQTSNNITNQIKNNEGENKSFMIMDNEFTYINKFLFGKNNREDTPVDFISNLPEEFPGWLDDWFE